MSLDDLMHQIYKARKGQPGNAGGLAICARLSPAAKSAWDENALPDAWLAPSFPLYELRARLCAPDSTSATLAAQK